MQLLAQSGSSTPWREPRTHTGSSLDRSKRASAIASATVSNTMHHYPTPLRRLLPTVLATFLFAACQAIPTTMPIHAQLAHDVYFALEDASPEASQKLVADCYAKLAHIDGVVFLAAGTRDPDLVRDLNDRDYDVSLHVFFSDRAAHDAYATAPTHLEFIAANKDNWRGVRVFDSNLRAR